MNRASVSYGTTSGLQLGAPEKGVRKEKLFEEILGRTSNFSNRDRICTST